MANHEDPGNPCLRNFGTAKRVGKASKPCQTMVSGGATSTPLIGATSTPLIGATSTPLIGATSEYSSFLDRELPKDKPASRSMSLASFFCCAGGIDLGFRSAGFDLAFANDINPRAVETFAANLGHSPVHRDIRGVGAADYPLSPVDVVTGGFPCVTFSTAGKRAGVTDDINGKLYLELCRVISEINPRYFVAENVEGMLSANGGAAVKLVLASFLRLGYRTSYQLVNMAEHGVPQTRKRVIFVGVRLDQWRGSFAFPKKSRRLAGDKLAPGWLPVARSLREAIGDLPAPGERLSGVVSKAGDFGKGGKVFRGAGKPSGTITSSNGDQMVAMNHEPNNVPAYAFNQAHSMAKRSAPAPTMSTPKQNAPFVEANTLRRMTVRECARVQTFPDWYEFKGSQADGYELVGNAVPPLYAKRLAEAILEYDARRNHV